MRTNQKRNEWLINVLWVVIAWRNCASVSTFFHVHTTFCFLVSQLCCDRRKCGLSGLYINLHMCNSALVTTIVQRFLDFYSNLPKRDKRREQIKKIGEREKGRVKYFTQKLYLHWFKCFSVSLDPYRAKFFSFFGGYSTTFPNNHNLLSGVWVFGVGHIGELDDDTQKDGKELKHIC